MIKLIKSDAWYSISYKRHHTVFQVRATQVVYIEYCPAFVPRTCCFHIRAFLLRIHAPMWLSRVFGRVCLLTMYVDHVCLLTM